MLGDTQFNHQHDGQGTETAKPTLYCYRYILTFSEEKTS